MLFRPIYLLGTSDKRNRDPSKVFFRVLSRYAGRVKSPLPEHVPEFKYSSLFRPKSLIGTSDKANISTNRAKFFSGFCAGARAVGETPALVPHYGRNFLVLSINYGKLLYNN